MSRTTALMPQERTEDTTAFSAIFVASFVLLLGVAIVALLFTWQWRTWLPGAENEKSLIAGVKAAVYSFLPHVT